ncbi:MAG: RDD family protein [Clostridia bacterium]|nr:RDD family protein [Clostridia bacterium]
MADDILTKKIEYTKPGNEDPAAEPVRALEEGPGVRPRYFVDISTHENVTIRYESAGLGSRYAASLIDLAIRVLFWLTVFFIIYEIFFAGQNIIEFAEDIWEGAENAVYAIMAAYFGITLSRLVYFEIIETVWSGYTPGKRIFRIRAVSVTGEAASFSQITVRTVMRFLHLIPGGEFADGVAALFSAKRQRLGDMAAGTMVIKVGRVKNAGEILAKKVAEESVNNAEAGEEPEKDAEDGFGRAGEKQISDFLAEMHALTEKTREEEALKNAEQEEEGDRPANVIKFPEWRIVNANKEADDLDQALENARIAEETAARNRRNSYIPEGGYLTVYETEVLVNYLQTRKLLANRTTYDRKFAEYIFEKSGQPRPKKLDRNRVYSFISEVARYHAWLYGFPGGVRV